MIPEHYSPIQTLAIPKSEKIKNKLWGLIYLLCFKYTPSVTSLFRKWRVLVLRSFGADLSMTSSVHPKARIDFPWRLSMGENSSLGAHAWAYCLDKVTIGDYSCIGEDVYLLTGSHDINSTHFDLVTKPIMIGDCVWVATGSYLLPGVCLADLTIVAAKSVVTKSTEPNDVVGGNPAKFIKKRIIR